MTDRELVCACLHYRGVSQVPDNLHVETRRMADGFGPGHGPRNEVFWDWSHVRDSTKEAFAEMAGHLREHVNEKEIMETVAANGGHVIHPYTKG